MLLLPESQTGIFLCALWNLYTKIGRKSPPPPPHTYIHRQGEMMFNNKSSKHARRYRAMRRGCFSFGFLREVCFLAHLLQEGDTEQVNADVGSIEQQRRRVLWIAGLTHFLCDLTILYNTRPTGGLTHQSCKPKSSSFMNHHCKLASTSRNNIHSPQALLCLLSISKSQHAHCLACFLLGGDFDTSIGFRALSQAQQTRTTNAKWQCYPH